jgi:hypothetical protein
VHDEKNVFLWPVSTGFCNWLAGNTIDTASDSLVIFA